MGNSQKFLFIDDGRDSFIMLSALVKAAFPESEIFSAKSSEEGLQTLLEIEPDVILLKDLLPKMDGFEVCSRIKRNPNLADVPVLFLMASKSDKESRIKALQSGGEAFLENPFNEVEVYVQLRSMLKIREKNLIEKEKTEKLNELVLWRTEELEGLKEKYKNLLEDLPALICEFLPDSTLTFVNQGYCQYYEQKEEDLIGKKFLEFLPENQQMKIQRNYIVLTPSKPTNVSTERIAYKDQTVWIEWRNRGFFDKRGQARLFLSIGFDVTQRKMAEQRLVVLSFHDDLTGLYNRRFFEEEMKRLDQPRNMPLTIVMADVNGLKIVNDSFGHKAGDQLLKRVAEALREGFRADDIIARIGGDEFAVILTKTNQALAAQIVCRAKKKVDMITSDNVLQSVSFGFETKTVAEEDVNEVFAQAENFMYQHKIYESASMRSKAVKLIMNSLFEKSQREMSHSERVGEIAASIALKLQLPKERIMEIRTAGFIHDIGKIGVQEQILNKDGKLTREEWMQIKQHPEAGRRILSSIDEFRVVANYILFHHERWDGKGYPNQIAGEKIPIEARIISVADAYDAMTSERSYRKSMSREAALQEIERNSGSQFDPYVVQAFLAIEISDDWATQIENNALFYFNADRMC